MGGRATGFTTLGIVASLLCAGCVTQATEVLVFVGTDVPLAVPMSLQIVVVRGVVGSVGTRRPRTIWTRGDVNDVVSFAIVPGEDDPRDGSFTLQVEAVTPDYTIRRLVSAAFVPGRAVTLRLFLTARCAAELPEADCAANFVSAPCTVQSLCEHMRQSCDENGRCVDAMTPTMPVTDSGTMPRPDVPTVRDVPGVLDVPMVLCGTAGRPCCSGVCGSGTVCDTGTCVACGRPAQPCCDGNSCSSGALCTGSGCRACGGSGELCCSGSVCNGSTVCSGGTCVGCGTVGRPCCAGGSCSGGASCSGGTCASCGAQDQPCCAGGGCAAGTACAAGFCRCGQVGLPCCLGFLCSSGVCAGGTCVTCTGIAGSCAAGQACCAPTTCGSTSLGTVCCGGPAVNCTASNQCCGSLLCCTYVDGRRCGSRALVCP